MTNKLFLEQMTSPEAGDAIASGYTTIIVPCGAVEQHGPHLPMFVDAEHGTALALAIAERMEKTLVAPTIRIGISEHHMDFPGTISLSADTFEAVCKDYCKSLARHGFKKICMLPSHGGNFKPLSAMVDRLNRAAGKGVQVVAFTDLVAFLSEWREIVESEIGLGKRVGGHADIAETSIMLALHESLVKQDLAVEGFLPDVDQEVVDRIIRDGFKSVTTTGVLGDARGGTAELGNRLIEKVADGLARFFEKA